MAIGLGRMFGFEYLENFNYPFISKSIHEFWQRWHISLSNWFRDYFYMPMVVAFARHKQKTSPSAKNVKFDDRLPLALVFFVCGIWHGASWNFAVFGMLHGLFLVLERGSLGVWLKCVPNIISRLYVFLVILLAWVFFRCETLPGAVSYLHAMFSFHFSSSEQIGAYLDQRMQVLLPIAILGATPLLSSLTRDWRERATQAFGEVGRIVTIEGSFWAKLDPVMACVRLPLLAVILSLSIIYIAGKTYNPFLYFRF
jgi:alginate O-acetyltransferase complex protein AlgI